MQSVNSRLRLEQHGRAPRGDTQFRGFPNLTANFVYCPNQFFDVCLPNSSRGTVRIVAYLLRRTLGWLDANGDPIEQEIRVSYRENVSEAGIARGAVRESIDEAIRGRFILCIQPGRANTNEHASQTGCFALRWDAEGQYTKDADAFQGFFAGEGHRTPIPNAFFDQVVRNETLAVTKVVGTVLRHTVGYQNQFGRRLQAPLSYTYIQQYARIRDRSTISQALHQALKTGYIRQVDEGHFDPSRSQRKAATYAVRWLHEATDILDGSEIRPAIAGQFKNPTSQPAAVQKPDQAQSKNPTSDGSHSRPAKQSRNPTPIKTVQKKPYKQQDDNLSVAAVGNSEGYRLLKAAGLDDTLANRLSKLASHSEIELQIAWLPRRNPERNPLGMLRRAIEEGWSAPTNPDPAATKLQSRAGENRQATIQAAVNQELTDKERLRAVRLATWAALSAGQKAKFFRQAMERAESDFTRSRLRRHRDLDNPPTEVLAMMTEERGVIATAERAPTQ